MLTNLKYHDYGEDTEYFCCQSVGDCFLISPATDWTEPSVPGLTRLESTGLIHDVTLLTLDLRPRPAPSSTETPPAGGSTDPPDTEAPVEKKKRGTGNNWRQDTQFVCVVGGVSGSNERCRSVLLTTIQNANSSKTPPSFEDLIPGRLYVMVESGTKFEMVDLDSRGPGGRCPFITKRSKQYLAYQGLLKRGTELLGGMLSRLETLESLYSERLSPSCESDTHQLVACSVLKLDCLDIPLGKIPDVRRICRDLEKYKGRTKKSLIYNVLLYNYDKTIQDLVTNSNALAFNQQSLEAGLNNAITGIKRLQTQSGLALNEVKADLSNLALKVFHLNAQSELKNFVLSLALRREDLSRELDVVQSGLGILAGRFQAESEELLNLLRGKYNCKYLAQSNNIVCAVSAGVVSDQPDNNGLVVISEGEAFAISEYRLIKCLPIGSQISIFTDKLWLLSDGYLSRKEIRFPVRCLYDAEASGECGETLVTMSVKNQPGRLFKDQNIFFLQETEGVEVNCAGAETSLAIKDRGKNVIKVNNTPQFIGWERFPLSSGGVTIKRRDLETDTDNLQEGVFEVLDRYATNHYQMHLDGYHPTVNQQNTSLEMSIKNFPNLIRNDPVVQGISGFGVTLIVVVVIMATVCCIKSQQCRDAGRRCCCWCCNLGKLRESAVEKLRKEREHWEEYQLLRREDGAHGRGTLGAGSGTRRYGLRRGLRFEEEQSDDHIGSAPPRV